MTRAFVLAVLVAVFAPLPVLAQDSWRNVDGDWVADNGVPGDLPSRVFPRGVVVTLQFQTFIDGPSGVSPRGSGPVLEVLANCAVPEPAAGWDGRFIRIYGSLPTVNARGSGGIRVVACTDPPAGVRIRPQYNSSSSGVLFVDRWNTLRIAACGSRIAVEVNSLRPFGASVGGARPAGGPVTFRYNGYGEARIRVEAMGSC